MTKLPLTLFERYLLHEDREAYPCWILIRYRFQGVLQKAALQTAWERTVKRHPLLSAVVRRDWLGRLVWEQALGYEPRVEWREDSQVSGWPYMSPIDLMRAPGSHLLAIERGGFTDLFTQDHHALHDGAGCFAIVSDLLAFYVRELGADAIVSEIHPEQFRFRNRFGLTLRDRLRLLPMQVAGLAISLQLHFRKVAPLLPGPALPDQGHLPPILPALASRRLGSTEFECYRKAAKRLGSGLQDLLIRDVQAALGEWLSVHGKAGPMDWVRLTVPINLRRPADITLPAANLVGLVIIDRRRKSLANRERLLRRAREDMGFVRRFRLGYVFLVMLALCRLIPGGIRRYARRSGCRTTFLFTNLGQVMSNSSLYGRNGKVTVPGAILEDISLAAPVSPGTCAGLSVIVYANGLAADLSYDSRVLSEAQANDLVQAFVDQIRLTSN